MRLHARGRGAIAGIILVILLLVSALPASAPQVGSSDSVLLGGATSPGIFARANFSIVNSSPTTSPTITTNAGDALFLFIELFGTQRIHSVSDSRNDSFQELQYSFESFHTPYGSLIQQGLDIWVAFNISGGSTSVTATAVATSHLSDAISVLDITGVSPNPVDRLSTSTNSSNVGGQIRNYSNRIQANASDLVLSAVSARNYNLWTPAGVASRVDNVVAPTKGYYNTIADFQYTPASAQAVWMNATTNVSSAWIAQSIAIKPGTPYQPPTRYAVSFSETGLPSGAGWTVRVAGTNYSATAPAAVTLTQPNGTYAYTVASTAGLQPHPGSGTVAVSGANASVAIGFLPPPNYTVTVTEQGLVNGTNWSIVFDTSGGSAIAPGAIVFSAPNGSYGYSVGAVPGYGALASSGTVDIAGGNVSFTVQFVPIYPLTFSETGLPNGTPWAISLNGSNGSALAPGSVSFLVPDGNYTFAVTPVFGFVANPFAGSVQVAGQSANVSISFAALKRYSVVLNESGLAAGTNWTVSVNASALTVTAPAGAAFSLPNGTYPYSVSPVAGYRLTPASGTLHVHGSSVVVQLNFTEVFSVAFTESGLATGTSWTVTLQGTPRTAVAPANVTFTVGNGTYGFSVAALEGYNLTSAANGTIVVNGSAVQQSVSFYEIPHYYSVAIHESGLALGLSWNATLDGVLLSPIAPNDAVFAETNGTYALSVGNITGYDLTGVPANVTVAGAARVVNVTFQLLYLAPPGSHIQHVVVIMLENQEASNIWKSGPYERYLLSEWGNASSFYATCHSSTSLYMAITSGRTFGCNVPGPVSSTNIGDLFDAYGLSWMGYMESMPHTCDTNSTDGTYLAYHDPFVLYTDIRNNASRCAAHVVNSSQFNDSLARGVLPNFAMYIPNYVDDGHGPTQGYWNSTYGLPYIESFLKNFLPPILNHTGRYNSSAERNLVNHTAFMLVYDEGNTNLGYTVPGYYTAGCTLGTQKFAPQPVSACGGHVTMTMISPYSKHTHYTDNAATYSVLSTIESLFNLPGVQGTASDGSRGMDGTWMYPPMSSLCTCYPNGYFTYSSVGPSPAPAAGFPLTPLLTGFAVGAAIAGVGAIVALLLVGPADPPAAATRPSADRTPRPPARRRSWPGEEGMTGGRSGHAPPPPGRAREPPRAHRRGPPSP